MPNERTKLIRKLDISHSVVVRKLAMEPRYESVTCYTCDARAYWQQMTCGHFWSRKCKSIRWQFDNCRPQCRACQGRNNGERKIFEDRLREEIGDERVNALTKHRDIIKQWTADELKALLAERKEQLKNISKRIVETL